MSFMEIHQMVVYQEWIWRLDLIFVIFFTLTKIEPCRFYTQKVQDYTLSVKRCTNWCDINGAQSNTVIPAIVQHLRFSILMRNTFPINLVLMEISGASS